MTDENVTRAILPISDQQHVGPTTYDAKDPANTYPPIEPLRPPNGAPNILVVLLDDVGFAASSVFGGPVDAQAPGAGGDDEAQVVIQSPAEGERRGGKTTARPNDLGQAVARSGPRQRTERTPTP